MLKTYRELEVWKKSFALCMRVYGATRTFPEEEKYGLRAQLRRCAVSVPSNIAEGYGRQTRRDYLRFLWVANGSLAELETQLLLARELGLCSERDAAALLYGTAEIDRMLKALIRALKRKEGSR